MLNVPRATADRLDLLDPLSRLEHVLDRRSVAALAGPEADGVRAVRGRIDGAAVVAFCTDATTKGGALGIGGAERIVKAIDTALAERVPVVGVWHSGGARLGDGVESLHGAGLVFRAITRASGRVPQLSVIVGPAAGAAAYGPGLTDLVIMAPAGRVFITGPDVVHSVTGESIDAEELGGSDAHGRRSGVVHLTTDSEASAYESARRLVGFFARPGRFRPESAGATADPSAALPTDGRDVYDVLSIVDSVLDDGLTMLQRRWAPNVCVGFGRLTGRAVGVVANNPRRKGGCLDSLSAEKAARFVRLCDAFGVPLLVIVDVPGYLPGVDEEWSGVVRRGAKLLHAFAEAVTPRVTLVTRRAYGGAYIAMNSRSLGATRVLAWPGAEVAVMAAGPAVEILGRRRLAAAPLDAMPALRAQLISEQERTAGGVHRALELGAVDEVIDPVRTRAAVAAALAAAPPRRGDHNNIPL